MAAVPTSSRPARAEAIAFVIDAYEGVDVRPGKGLPHAQGVADVLRRAGYEVVATQPALGEFPVSRLYYSEGHLADALGLRRRFPEFKQVEPAPKRLSREVDVHAVVGRDYRP